MASKPAEVIVDDRLATVLSTTPAGHAGARTQYRQLLDLLGRTSPDFPIPRAARVRLEALEAELPADERAQLLRGMRGSLRHPGLILRLAGQAPAVAAAAILAARLDDWQWSALALELPLAARGYLRHRSDLGPRTRGVLERLGIIDLGLPAPAMLDQPRDRAETIVDELASLPEERGDEGIGAIVRRIEAFRRSRQAASRQFENSGVPGEVAPQLPLRELAAEAAPAPAAIRFSTSPQGRIVAADAPFAPMLAGFGIGTSEARAAARCDDRSARAVAQRRPVRGGRLTIDGAPLLAGAWRVDAMPRFAEEGGHFLGYSGVLRRPERKAAERETPADRLRQLLHELRTPVNAIQGFAELIQQQIFGPAPHQYRSLAAGIAADSAAVLAGFDDIDRLVKYETGHGEDIAGKSDAAAVVERLLAQLDAGAKARHVSLGFDAAGPAHCAVARDALERLLWRTIALLASEAAPGETIVLELAARHGALELGMTLPERMSGRGDRELLAVGRTPGEPGPAFGLLGGGFALRLARAEARSVGGELVFEEARLVLRLPGLTPAVDANSPLPAARSG